MAERRMFAKSVVLADRFLDLSHRVRNLYFMLGMVADDDGFINAPKSILRQAGARTADLEALEQAGYILRFDSGVTLIRHWKVNNRLQKDRCKPTMCQAEMNMVRLDGGVYTKWTQDGHILDTQDRIGQDREGQVREGHGGGCAPQSDVERVFDLFGQICTGLVACKTLTPRRQALIRARLENGMGVEDFERVFRRAQGCDFLRGGGTKGWRAGLDWLLDKDNMARLEEGAYDGREAVPTGGTGLGEAEMAAIRELMDS